MPVKIDMTGQKYGRLMVVSFSHQKKQGSYWNCICDCGKEKTIRALYLKNGTSTSCGCFRSEYMSKRNYKHGHSQTKEFNTWDKMIRRCHQETEKSYSYYGGRGIEVCQKWRDSFDSFLADMGRAPTPLHTLDRIDNDKGYSLENCKWATKTEQSRNKRNTRYLTLGTETKCIAEWGELLKMHRVSLRQRILKQHWTLEQLSQHTDYIFKT